MGNISRMLSALWGILVLIVLFTLFIVYANFPDGMNLEFLDLERTVYFERQRFFYVFAALILVINLIIYLTIRVTATLKRMSISLSSSQHLRIAVAVKIMVCGGNFFLIILMIYLKSAIESESAVGLLPWLALMLGPVVIVVGLFYLFYILVKPVND